MRWVLFLAVSANQKVAVAGLARGAVRRVTLSKLQKTCLPQYQSRLRHCARWSVLCEAGPFDTREQAQAFAAKFQKVVPTAYHATAARKLVHRLERALRGGASSLRVTF